MEVSLIRVDSDKKTPPLIKISGALPLDLSILWGARPWAGRGL